MAIALQPVQLAAEEVQADTNLDHAAFPKVCAWGHTYFVPFKPQHSLADYLLWIL